MRTERALRCVACAIAAIVMLAAAPNALALLPTQGQTVPQLAAVDNLFQSFVTANNIPGADVAITHGGKVVYERGFGYTSPAHTSGMSETALMRLASVSKPITAAAIQRLITQNRLSLDTKVFKIGSNNGLLDIPPAGALGDSRLADITVRELLQHTGGWNRDTAGDLAFRDITIANAMGVNSPPGIYNSARYILSQPLQFTPGTQTNYSNIGYMFLGMVVEKVSGTTYNNYVQKQVLPAAGIPIREIEPGRTFPADRNPREPSYITPYKGPNVFDPAGPYVYYPDGGWDHERFMAFGGMIASAKALAMFANTYIASGPEIGVTRANYHTYTNYWWYHTGSLDGTDTVMLEDTAGWTYSILFNQRPSTGSYSETMVTNMQSLLGSLTASQWPAPLQYPGDLDNNQWLTETDIDLFRAAWNAGSASAFLALYPTSRYDLADFDGNHIVDASDIPGFELALLHAGVPASALAAIPEPAPAVFLALLVGLSGLYGRSVATSKQRANGRSPASTPTLARRLPAAGQRDYTTAPA